MWHFCHIQELAVITTPWNKYEVALLIDTYERIRDGKISKKEAISQLSLRLRAKVIAQGGAISEKYRNENGMDLQLSKIAYLITDGADGLDGGSRMFEEVVDEYKHRNMLFMHTLILAERLYPIVVLPAKVVPISNSVKEKNDKQAFVNDPLPLFGKARDEVREVLEKKFAKGFRLDSSIEMRRYRKYYSDIHGKELDIDDEALVYAIRDCCIVNDEKAYLPENVLSEESRNELISYIEDMFANDYTFVYYGALLEDFHDMFIDSFISDRQSLCQYLKYFDKDNWDYETFFIAKNRNCEPSPELDVLRFLKEQGDAVDDDTVCKSVKSISSDKVKWVLSTNPEQIISTGREGKHFHISNFQISDSDKSQIENVIDRMLEANIFESYNEISKHIKERCPRVFTDNEHYSDFGIRNALKAIFSDKYDFNSNIVSKKGYGQNALCLFALFCVKHESFTIEEANNLAKEFGTVIPFETVYKLSVRLDKDKFINKDKMHFDIEATDNAIAKFVEGDYVSIGKIDTFTAFPDCGFAWNQYLLESYLATFSHAFKLMHLRFNGKGVAGAVVRHDAPFNDYEELLIDAVAQSRVALKQNEILDFLKSEQYILRLNPKLLKNAKMIERAQQIRNKTR